MNYFAGIIAVIILCYWLYNPYYENVLNDTLLLESGLPAGAKLLAYHYDYGFQDPTDEWLLEFQERNFEKILAGKIYQSCDKNVLDQWSSRRFGTKHEIFKLKHCFTNWSGNNNRLLTEIYTNETKTKAIVSSTYW